MANAYLTGLNRNRANYAPLTPLSFLFRSADVFPHKLSVIYNDLRYTWAQTAERCRRLASALRKRGIVKNDTVAVMLPNVPAMVEAHFGKLVYGAFYGAHVLPLTEPLYVSVVEGAGTIAQFDPALMTL